MRTHTRQPRRIHRVDRVAVGIRIQVGGGAVPEWVGGCEPSDPLLPVSQLHPSSLGNSYLLVSGQLDAAVEMPEVTRSQAVVGDTADIVYVSLPDGRLVLGSTANILSNYELQQLAGTAKAPVPAPDNYTSPARQTR